MEENESADVSPEAEMVEQAENPPEEEVAEATDVKPEASPAKTDESPTELPTPMEEPDTGEMNPFPDDTDVLDADEEEAESVLLPNDRPPPMAPPPAIFNRDDVSAPMGGSNFGDEFMDEAQLSPEVSKHPPVPVETKSLRTKPAVKLLPTYPFRAKKRTEKEIETALRKAPPRHEYCGFLFSSYSERPKECFANYFLPIYPQPQPKRHVDIKGIPIPMDKIFTNKDMPREVLPLSTIKITWASSRTRTIYKLESLYAYLTRFGPIDGIYSKSINSAYVIFSDLEAATVVVTCHHLGEPWDPLIAFWVEPRMYNSGFYHKYAALEAPPLRIRI